MDTPTIRRQNVCKSVAMKVGSLNAISHMANYIVATCCDGEELSETVNNSFMQAYSFRVKNAQ
jgi:hypothetical protein